MQLIFLLIILIIANGGLGWAFAKCGSAQPTGQAISHILLSTALIVASFTLWVS